MSYRTNKELNRFRKEAASTDSSQSKRVKARKYQPMSAERYAEIQRENERRAEEIRAEIRGEQE